FRTGMLGLPTARILGGSDFEVSSRLSRAGSCFRHAPQFLNAKRRFEFQNRNCQAVRTGLQVEYTNVGLTTLLRVGGLSNSAAGSGRPRSGTRIPPTAQSCRALELHQNRHIQPVLAFS